MGREDIRSRKFTRREKEIILSKTGCKCGHCGKSLDVQEATVDHIIPVYKGGLNDEFNLIALCHKCNEEKSNFLYDVMDYYKYILPEYKSDFYSYHAFAITERSRGHLFDYDTTKYVVYPDKQKQIITSMMRRGANKKKIENVMKQLGISLFLSRAYTGDAKEIMDLIVSNVEHKNTYIKHVYYKNEYMLLNDIKDGEVYVLRSSDDKICGAFTFKRITADELNIPQLNSIAMNTKLDVKYVMTGAFIDWFAHEAFDNIMSDITGRFIMNKAIPLCFNVLSDAFRDADECIIIPWSLENVSGSIEFMTLKYLRKMALETAQYVAHRNNEELTEDEMELFSDALLNYQGHDEIGDDDLELHKLFENHESLQSVFRPETHALYNVGFITK